MYTVKQDVVNANNQVISKLKDHLNNCDEHARPKYLSIRDKYFGEQSMIEIVPNSTPGILPFRFITSAGIGLWTTFESEEHIEQIFKSASLI